MIVYSKCDLFCLLGNNVDRVSHFIGWQLIRLMHVFESVATQWVFTTVSLANLFCGCFCWALAPFAVCFAVLWMVRRKSGWGDLRLAFRSFVRFVVWLSFFAMFHVTTCVHVDVFLITASSHVRTEP